MLVDANLASALSVIYIDGRGTTPSSLSCNLSLFLINEADQQAGLTSDVAETKDAARETRWRQLVAAHAQKVGEACGWRDQRSEQPRTQSASADAKKE